MRILIEAYQYDANLVKNVLHGIDALENVEGKVSIHYVGYFYNTRLKDCVFILPKVLLQSQGQEKELVFGEHRPEDILNLNEQNPLSAEQRQFIYKFSVWIYRAIVVYKNDVRNDTDIVYHATIAQVGHGQRRLSNTFLDILLSLLQFNRENQHFFFFILKNLHSGLNKINWNRTIATQTAIVQNDTPVYLRPVNKKKQINFDEELLIIFFSILNYIGDHYGFQKYICCQFQLITGNRFEQYLNGFGKMRLRQIKYKYFSDKALQLWDLCYAFFEEVSQVQVATEQREYLLVKSFYTVFERIIDELVGDNPLPDNLDRKQADGKIVDHLYTAQSLIDQDNRQTYYIGDSKYYKMGNPLTEEAIAKQYTYARNLIQWNLDVFKGGRSTSSGIRLRDEVTEGYNIIPNFFISAKMDQGFDYDKDGIDKTYDKTNRHSSTQFKDRLFDRDTLLLFHFDVNFLFILSLYARNKAAEKAEWKKKIRNKFRDEIRAWLKEDYSFFALKCKGNPLEGEQFIKEHFYELMGKVFRPYEDRNIYALALEKNVHPKAVDSYVYGLLSECFEIVKIDDLGMYPKKELDELVRQHRAENPYLHPERNLLPQYHLERYLDQHIVVGMYHDEAHWNWITGQNDKGTLIYNVRLNPQRSGAQVKTHIRRMKPKFAILYENGQESQNRYHVFRIHDFAVMSEHRMSEAKYPRTPQGEYFIFRFDEEVSLGRIDLNSFLSKKRLEKDFVEGAPLYPTGDELLAYRQ